MTAVWKYPIRLREGGIARFHMPALAYVMHVATQSEDVCLWAIVNPDEDREWRTFEVVGTGQPFDSDLLSLYIGTAQMDGYVWHVFERERS